MRILYVILLGLVLTSPLGAQQVKIKPPKSLSGLTYHKDTLGIEYQGKFYPLKENKNPLLTFDKIATPEVKSTEKGIEMDFRTDLNGTIYYGIIDDSSRYRMPVISKRTAKIKHGKALIRLDKLKGKYDFSNWEKTGLLRIGYRIVNQKGLIVADNRQNILYHNGRFTPDVTLIEGPVLALPGPNSMTLYLRFNEKTPVKIRINDKLFELPEKENDIYEIEITGLKPGTYYRYEVIYGPWSESYGFRTAPLKGCRTPLRFAYASDSRNARGGGERNIYGTNAYILKRMMIAADRENPDFFMFTGDMISGYSNSRGVEELQYFNFKNAIRYFSAWHPMFFGMGNHEALSRSFRKWDSHSSAAWMNYISVDRFPYATESAERLFSDMFVLPQNGPESEDGAEYDPSPRTRDFPPYGETAYYFTYGNLAMVVLNSNYWYTTNENYIPIAGGNPHAYLMDMQLKWLEQTLKKLDHDPDIDHVIVTVHTPPFPNAGHAENDMWYYGNNEIRPWVAGKPVKRGIIEQRDKFLDILVNKSDKFRALLCGDEHNYTRLTVDNNTDIYPEGWKGERLKLRRPFIQITNGAAGAPYYAPEKLPWSDHVQKFSTQNALMIFDVVGPHIHVRVFNPDTFELIEEFQLQ
ncbi:MAG: hypothetical protein GXO24_02510 [Chlorobi bacterium]|nr:hypothetical protein [Chlorobiota bacterium]